jgi:hypothetical protein
MHIPSMIFSKKIGNIALYGGAVNIVQSELVAGCNAFKNNIVTYHGGAAYFAIFKLKLNTT